VWGEASSSDELAGDFGNSPEGISTGNRRVFRLSAGNWLQISLGLFRQHPLICDVKVENGELAWDHDLPPGGAVDFLRSPIGLHDPGQVTGTPLFDTERFLVKFHNLWTIEAPEGYSLLFTHPVNRFDLPFTTLTGLVDCDRYHDAWIHFPARWNDPDFRGVLPRGTPIAQCFPIKRDRWVTRTAPLTEEETQRALDLTSAISREMGVYRRQYRA
jgi:hypothetical protein